jgi:hypothetical protein
VKGLKNYCSFEIKYMGNANPYQSVRLTHPYDISVQNGEEVRFIYFHQNPKGFRIVEMASAGDAAIFAMPILQSNFTLSSLAGLSYDSFPSFAENGGEFTV